MEIKLTPTDRGTLLVREWQDPTTGQRWFIEVCRMMYNDRLVMAPEDTPWGWEYGWCFERGPSAPLAGAAWDPVVEDEPAGWHKRTGMLIRMAPHRDADARIRCDHGAAAPGECSYVSCRFYAEDYRDG